MESVELNTTLLLSPLNAGEIVVASDLEGTVTAGSTWEGLRDYLIAHGHQQQFRRWMRGRIPRLIMYRLNLTDREAFKFEWLTGLLRLFKGYTRDEFDAVAQWVLIEHLWPTRRQTVVDELRAHRAEGRRVVLVSGMIEPLLRIVAQEVGNVDAIGTPLEFVDDVFSGELADPFNVGPRKVAQLRYFATDGKIHSAYGDTVRDIPMLEMAFDPVVVAPDAGLREAAAANNWRIIPE